MDRTKGKWYIDKTISAGGEKKAKLQFKMQ